MKCGSSDPAGAPLGKEGGGLAFILDSLWFHPVALSIKKRQLVSAQRAPL